MLKDRQLCSQVCKIVLIPSKLDFPVTAQSVNNLPAMQETQVQFLGWEDPLEKETATHSNILAWRIPRSENLENYSPWGCRESDRT